MNGNAAKIRDGICRLTAAAYEIRSGKVLAGSVNTDNCTISVQTNDDAEPIHGVLLAAVTGAADGLIRFPKEGSHVVIGCIDGPGEWCLLNTSLVDRVLITTGSIKWEIDGTGIRMINGSTELTVAADTIKMNTGAESLFQLLKDCFTYIAAITVPTPAGPSGIPANVADFTNLLARLNNLLSS